MKPHYEDGGLHLWHGSNKDILPTFPDNTFDSIVTDPPYELGFMGKGWDSSGIAYDVDLWRECLRVLKPGGHLLTFGGTRTWHRMTVAIEDAGFEIRDSIAWLYGSGFPKSMDVAKAIASGTGRPEDIRRLSMGEDYAPSGRGRVNYDHGGGSAMNGRTGPVELSVEAERWQGWGTALKPAHEPIVVARKPLAVPAWTGPTCIGCGGKGVARFTPAPPASPYVYTCPACNGHGREPSMKPATVAENVLAYGTGALNIDANRIHTAGSEGKAYTVKRLKPGATLNREGGNWRPDDPNAEEYVGHTKDGRFPPNVLLDESQAAALDEQSGVLTSGLMKARTERAPRPGGTIYGADKRNIVAGDTYADSGGASRFFPTFRYEAKAPSSERPEVDGVQHSTVKPLDLMRWLVRLVTRPGGHVLDPFAGSGTTGEAALLEGMEVTLIELEADHLPLIMQRVHKPLQPAMFGL
ncbi:DNA methyltransferase [Microbacterium terrisoli]|uniref:DNA methyltransferase n=1 Tax=Microbacterium terrisoli TaxID=3242192 RepID=UPI0028062385|nr:DNA methyltransferase [Microbacterium protaetiae]